MPTHPNRREAVTSQEWWDFRPGQRVMTREGYAGVVDEVVDGPHPGNEVYIVTLDAGMGGGEYGPSELNSIDGSIASTRVSRAPVVQPEGSATDDTFHLASDDYPMLSEILVERPPLENVRMASKTAGVWWHELSPEQRGQEGEADYNGTDPVGAWQCPQCQTWNPEWDSQCRSCSYDVIAAQDEADLRRGANIIDKVLDAIVDNVPDNMKPRPGHDWSYDWCFSGDTEFLTFDGPRSFKEVAGTTQRVLDGKGDWVEAEVRSFGTQALRKITLKKRRGQKVIYATGEHRWFVREGDQMVEKHTDDLLPGDRLSYKLPRSLIHKWTPSPFGIAHGIVYGDGTLTGTMGNGDLRGKPARVSLWGDKDAQLLRYFEGSPMIPRTGHAANQDANGVEVNGLPRFFKERPSLDEAPAYLYGWLAGYFAADGRVGPTGGNITLSSASREDLEFVQAVCNRLSISTYSIRSFERRSCAGRGRIHDYRVSKHGTCTWDDTTSSMNELTFVAETLRPEFFLIAEHRERFDARRARDARRPSALNDAMTWHVSSVEETDRVEEVYCAVVPTTESFVLQDGILTGNCRFRSNSRCMFPKELNAEATKQAGYAVWIPEDRGYCTRVKWDDQKKCFEGGTEFLTYDGIFSLKELEGETVKVLTSSGQWKDAEVVYFGVQDLYAVTLTRNGQEMVIHATADHRWFVRGRTRGGEIGRKDARMERATWAAGDPPVKTPPHRISDVDTATKTGTCSQCGPDSPLKPVYNGFGQWRCKEAVNASSRASAARRGEERRALREGDILDWQLPVSRLDRWYPNPTGVAHGAVFGDGSRSGNSEALRGNDCFITLFGEKDRQLLPFFSGCKQREFVPNDDRQVGGVTVSGLPRFFKDRPSLDESAEYLYGWLAGYFAADGNVGKVGDIHLDCADRETLEFVQAVCNRLTIATYGITTKTRKGCTGSGMIHDANMRRHGSCSMEQEREIHSLGFVASTLRPEFFIIEGHRSRFEARKGGSEPLAWRVVSVEETSRTEPVYCVVEPETESFTLANNILTGNCPVGEPGPKSGDPNARLDATVAWEDGGQRVSIRTKALADSSAPVNADGPPYFGGGYDNEPLESQVERLGQFILAQLPNEPSQNQGAIDTAIRLLDDSKHSASMSFHVLASWDDVQAKATRIRSAGGVRILANAGGTVTGQVEGDSGAYQASLTFTPGTSSIALWDCGCPWANYSWARSGRWKKYEGRMCSHALALSYEVQARGFNGGEVTEDAETPEWASDVALPGDLKSTPGEWRTASTTTEPHHLGLDPSLALSPAEAILHEASLKAKVRGYIKTIKALVGLDQVKLDDGSLVPVREVVHPKYDPRAGLNFTGSTAAMSGDEANDTVTFTNESLFTMLGEVGLPPYTDGQGGWIAESTQLDCAPIAEYLTERVEHYRIGSLGGSSIVRLAVDHSDGCMIALKPPAEILGALAVEGGLPTSEMHITLAYLGKKADINTEVLEQAMAVFSFGAPKLSGTISGYGTFHGTDGGRCLIALPDIPGLPQFRQNLVNFLTDSGFPVSESHGYTPHITIAYEEDSPGHDPEDGTEWFEDIQAKAGQGLPAGAQGTMEFDTFAVVYGDEWTHYTMAEGDMGMEPVAATLQDEPEPALPTTDGSEEDDAVELAQQRTAMKVFSPSEQRDIINEGDGTVTAANLDSLDIEGTHYVALEAALSEDDDRVNPEDLWANW